MTKRAEYIFALHAGSVAEPGDRNPYAGRSLVLAKLWMRGYLRMLRVRVDSGPAMARYLGHVPTADESLLTLLWSQDASA